MLELELLLLELFCAAVLELDELELELLGELDDEELLELLSAGGGAGTEPASITRTVASPEAPIANHAWVSRLPASSVIS